MLKLLPILPKLPITFHFPMGGKESGPNKTTRTRGVSHCGLALYIKKYLKAKEEL
jgi:hypothetical protein